MRRYHCSNYRLGGVLGTFVSREALYCALDAIQMCLAVPVIKDAAVVTAYGGTPQHAPMLTLGAPTRLQKWCGEWQAPLQAFNPT